MLVCVRENMNNNKGDNERETRVTELTSQTAIELQINNQNINSTYALWQASPVIVVSLSFIPFVVVHVLSHTPTYQIHSIFFCWNRKLNKVTYYSKQVRGRERERERERERWDGMTLVYSFKARLEIQGGNGWKTSVESIAEGRWWLAGFKCGRLQRVVWHEKRRARTWALEDGILHF